MIKKTLIFLLYVLLIVLLAIGCWVIQIWKFKEYWWMGLALFFGVIGLYLGVRWLRRVIYISKSKNRIIHAVKESEEGGRINPLLSLNAQWRKAMETLSNSALRKRGNPVYVLPWFMVMGDPGSGKTSALVRSRVPSPIREVSQSASINRTDNCEWWFFDNAIVIDTAGKYATADGFDRDEWERLLDLLAKYRKKEPLNGLVVTISAEKLLNNDHDTLAEEGRVLRNRINQLMHLLDTRFPVYVLVTKCDVLYGMDEWARNLPPKVLQQAMGYVGEETAGGVDVKRFVGNAFASVANRLKDLRLILMQRMDSMSTASMVFPSEFGQMQDGLEQYLFHTFGANPYMEAPFLRGLFFSSGEQVGTASSRQFQRSGIAIEPAIMKGGNSGMFLHDLFAAILPKDRSLHSPLGALRRWQQATRNIGLTSWVLLNIVFAAFLSYSFFQSANTIQHIREIYPAGAPNLSGKLRDDLPILSKFGALIRWMEQRDKQWVFHIIAFNKPVLDLENKLKEMFTQKMRKYVLPGLDAEITKQVEVLMKDDPKGELPEYIQILVRRINIVQARLDNKSYDELKQLPPPSAKVLFQLDPQISPEIADSFSEIYVAFMSWTPNDAFRVQRQKDLRARMKQIALESSNMSWLVEWANNQSNLRPVELKEFWQGDLRADVNVQVKPAFTTKGKEAIDGFMREVEASAPNPGAMVDKKAAFEAWYFTERLNAWVQFARRFPEGRRSLNGEQQWAQWMQRMPGDFGPYNNLLRRIVFEFEGYKDEAKLPDWVLLVRELHVVRESAKTQGILKDQRIATGIMNSIGDKIVDTTVTSGPAQGRKVFDSRLASVKTYQTYQTALGKVWQEALEGVGKSTKIASDMFLFSVDSSVKESQLHVAYNAFVSLRKQMAVADADSQAIWGLVVGPVEFYMEYVGQQTACGLQKEWNSKVMWPTRGATGDADLNDLLYGKQGSVWAFVDGPAKPFVLRNARQFAPAQVLGQQIPFSPLFFPFINDALSRKVAGVVEQEKSKLKEKQVQTESQIKLKETNQALDETQKQIATVKAATNNVKVDALPTNVNEGAKAKPHVTVLTVQCSAGARTISNYNFPVSETVTWNMGTCGDTTLDITIENLVLTKKWTGPRGFPNFLKDFYDGKKIFRASEFPGQKQKLDELDIKAINVGYVFNGHNAILSQIEKLNQLEALEKQKIDEKQGLQNLQHHTELLAIQEKRDSLESDPTSNVRGLPERIASCWDGGVAQPKQATIQDYLRKEKEGVEKVIENFLDKPKPAPKPLPPVQPIRPVEVLPPAEPPPAMMELVQPVKPVEPPKTGNYMVQLGMFPSEGADKVRSSLKEAGYTTTEFDIKTQGRVDRNISVGPYDSYAEAAEAAAKIDTKLSPRFRIKSMVVKLKPAN